MYLARFAIRLALGLMLACTGLSAQSYAMPIEVPETVLKEPWLEVQSRNFLVTGNAGARQLSRIAVDLEEIRRQFFTVFPRTKDSKVKTTIVVLRNGKSFRSFAEPGTAPEATAGYVYPGADRNYILLNAGEKHRRSVYHDYVHTLIGSHALPLWLREGLAEYYGSIENERYLIGDGRTTQIGYPISAHERLLQDRLLLPVDKLFAMTSESATYHEEDRGSVFLAESWALVHMLHHQGSADPLKRLLQLLVDGNPARRSFDAVFAAELGQVELSLKDYIHASKSGGWLYTRIPYCMCDSSPNDWLQFNFDRTLAYVKDLRERKLNPAEVRFYLGDLLLHRGQVREAEGYLREALKLDRKLDAAHASLGALLIREGRYDEARESIDQALALGSNNPLPYFFYAQLIRRENPALAELTPEQLQNMQTALLKAVRFAPNMNEAVDMLSEVDERLRQQ